VGGGDLAWARFFYSVILIIVESSVECLDLGVPFLLRVILRLLLYGDAERMSNENFSSKLFVASRMESTK